MLDEDRVGHDLIPALVSTGEEATCRLITDADEEVSLAIDPSRFLDIH
jgi:hypothetical protein